MLTVQDFSKSFGEVVALDQISLSIEAGEIVVLCGPSGAGKSTLLYMVAGLLPPDSGTVTLAEIDPYELSGSERTLLRGREIGMVFQDARLLSYLDIEANILAGGGSSDRAGELIEELGLADRRNHVPKKLSAGEQQRVGLANWESRSGKHGFGAGGIEEICQWWWRCSGGDSRSASHKNGRSGAHS